MHASFFISPAPVHSRCTLWWPRWPGLLLSPASSWESQPRTPWLLRCYHWYGPWWSHLAFAMTSCCEQLSWFQRCSSTDTANVSLSCWWWCVPSQQASQSAAWASPDFYLYTRQRVIKSPQDQRNPIWPSYAPWQVAWSVPSACWWAVRSTAYRCPPLLACLLTGAFRSFLPEFASLTHLWIYLNSK